MQNCYTSKKGPKHAQAADPESSHHDSEQDGRLTKKHIETLKFVQEIAEENKLLKIKIEELEGHLSRCAELHALAEHSQDRIKQIQEQYMARADEINRMLTEKHKQEMMKKINDNVDNEKLFSEERKQLQEEIEKLKKACHLLQERLDGAEKNNEEITSLQEKTKSLQKEVEQLRDENYQLKQANSNQLDELGRLRYVEDKCGELTESLTELRQFSQEQEFKMSRLQKEASDSGAAQQEELLAALRSKLTKIHKERTDLQGKLEVLQRENCDLQSENGKLRRVHADSERMRGQLQQDYNKLLQEMSLLQRHTSASQDKQSFKEFVQLKRDYGVLKEENEALKGRLKNNKISLPAIKQEVTVTRLTHTVKKSSKDQPPVLTYNTK